MAVCEQAEPNCMICAKHRGDGPLLGPKLWEDEYLLVSHRPVGQDGTTVLGYLYVETRRHVPYLADAGDQWPDAPRGTTAAVAELCGRLRPYLESEG